MRSRVLYLAAALTATAMTFAGGMAAAQSDRQTVRTWQAAPNAHACPFGYYWEPDSYAPHAKFRPAHCARRW